jgi:DNA mismatch repair protein MutS2
MHALKVLEFEWIQRYLASHCESPLGHTLALELLPSFEADEVSARLELTRETMRWAGQEAIPSLAPIKDVRIPAIAASKGRTLDPEVLFQIGEALATMRKVKAAIKSKQEDLPKLFELCNALVENQKTEDAVLRSVDSSGEVLDTASTALASLRKTKRNAAKRLTDRIQGYTTGPTREYLSDPIVTQRSGRYVVPVKSEHRGKIRGIVHDTSSSGQTLFVEPQDVLEIGNALREAEVAETAEIERILVSLSSRVGEQGEEISKAVERTGELDLLFAKVRYADQSEAEIAKPAVAGRIRIERGRHPLLDKAIAVPLTLEINDESSGLLITGPNTGGKTVSLKTVGLYILMNQCGMAVPAFRCEIGFFPQVWADIGDEQSLQQSLSTFSGHVKNIAAALQNLKPGAIMLLDEVGAGTDPAEGAALARAILTEIHRRGARVMASTHYGELKIFASETPGFINCSMEFDLKSLSPTYNLLIGTPGSSHALKIAERYGMPKSVIERAKDDQGVQAASISKMLEDLENAQRRAQKAQSEADRLANKLREVEQAAEDKLYEAEEIRRNARQRLTDKVDEEMRQVRLEVQDLLTKLKKGGQTDSGQVREKLQNLSQRGQKVADKFRPETPPKPKQTAEIVRGSNVRVRGYSQIGVVLEHPKDGKAMIQVGAMKITVKLLDLELEQKAPEKAKLVARKSLQLEKASTITNEIDLRGVRAEEAAESLDRYLDELVLAGAGQVRILHGKGEGILRKVTREVAASHRSVKSFRDGEATEGGQGVTVILLG